MTEPVVIGAHQCKWVKDTDTIMKTLYLPTEEPTGYYALVDSDNNSAYEVPTGKKFIILKLFVSYDNVNGGGANQEIWKHTSAGSAGGTRIWKLMMSDGTSATNTTQDVYNDVYIEIAAGNYINFDMAKTRAGCVVMGVECNA